MRLIRTKPPLQLGEFMDNELGNLKYAILSHRWEDDEFSFQEMLQPTDITRQKKGYKKIEQFCDRALRDGFEYAWVDTCCINKESSAELSEAINSMFRWYRDAGKCYAFMSDVAIDSQDDFSKSVWFTRGWTLQELIAPQDMVFLASNWADIGPRQYLASEISKITKIDESILLGTKSLESFCVSRRMSWAAGRETSRAEDRAYSLMGIFGVNMPLLYGEGNKAFIRLQEEIMKDTSDETLFAWEAKDVPKNTLCGLLAPSPDCFAESGDIMPYTFSQGGLPFVLTNRGIRMQSPLIPPDSSTTTLILQCVAELRLIGITIKPNPSSPNADDFTRGEISLIRGIPPHFLHNAVLHTIYIAKSFVDVLAHIPDLPSPDGETAVDTQSNHQLLRDISHRGIKPKGHFKKIILLFDDTASPRHGPGDESGKIANLQGMLLQAGIRKYYPNQVSTLHKLQKMLHRADGSQKTYYEPWRHKKPLCRIVSDANEFLKQNHQPGDQISLFGFGKGCHAVITLSHILRSEGIILTPGYILSNWVDLSSRKRDSPDESLTIQIILTLNFRGGFSRDPGQVEFIGLFDSVKFPPQLGVVTTTDIAKYGHIARHAIAIDEKQMHLKPNIVQEPADPRQNLQQMWFPGTHQDLGGTMNYSQHDVPYLSQFPLLEGTTNYSQHDVPFLSQLPLLWMAAEAEKAGLRLDSTGRDIECGGLPHPGIDLRQKNYKRPFRENFESRASAAYEKLSRSEQGALHSELEFGHGWYPPHVCKQNIKNLVYSKTFCRSTALKRGQREIPANAAVHASVIRRMKEDPDDGPAYRPSNLHIEDTDSLTILNAEDPVGKHFIYKPLISGHPQ